MVTGAAGIRDVPTADDTAGPSDTATHDAELTAVASRWSPANNLRSRCVALAVLAGIVCFLISQSPMIRVGDGDQYMGMAYAISTGHSPALSPAEWNATNRFLNSFSAESIYPDSLLHEAIFQNAAHGQNFPHFWMYSALAAPGLALSRLLGLNANWGFVLVNLLLYLLAAWLALRRLGLAGSVFLFLCPIIWWLDKATTEAFTFSLVAIAFLLLEEAPWWSIICLGFAADQNPPIALVIPVVVVAAWLRDRSRLRDRRMWIGTGAGVLIALLHPIFYETQLGVITPESLTTVHWQIPTLAILLAPITDLSMGLVANFPMFVVALIVVLVLILVKRWRDILTPEIGAAIAAAIIFLGSYAQNTQLNSGGTPSLDRYDLWLIPLIIPGLVICFRRDPRRMFWWFMPVAVVSAVISVIAFQPARPDSYLYPSRLASYVWAHYPTWDNPVPAVFYEREEHTETAIQPVGTPTCSKILLVDGETSAACPMRQLPPALCTKTSTTLCYANTAQPLLALRTERGYSFTTWSGPTGSQVPVTSELSVRAIANYLREHHH